VTGTDALPGNVKSVANQRLQVQPTYTILKSGLNGTKSMRWNATGITGSRGTYSLTGAALNTEFQVSARIAGLNANQRAVGTALDNAFNARAAPPARRRHLFRQGYRN